MAYKGMQDTMSVTSQLDAVLWSDIREQVKLVQSELANIIDAIPNIYAAQFIKAGYYYGANIVENGITALPISSHKTAPLGDNQLPTQINQLLCYHNDNPIGIILTHAVEVFLETDNRVIPLRIMDTGNIIGLWGAHGLSPTHTTKQAWHVTAGARTVFSLAKLSNNAHHLRLQRELGIDIEAPQTLLEQHAVFQEIAKQANNWHCEIIFFTKPFIETHWQPQTPLYQYAEQYILKELFFYYNGIIDITLVWEKLAAIVAKRRWQPKPVAINTLCHLLAIASDMYPAFAVAQTDKLLPLSLLKQVYQDYYQLADYPLIIMQPQTVSTTNTPLYYSLALPTLLECPVVASSKVRIINDLLHVRKLIKLLQQQDNVDCQYDFFHYSADALQTVNSSEVLAELDPQFMGEHSDSVTFFPYSSPFFRGCIQIVVN